MATTGIVNGTKFGLFVNGNMYGFGTNATMEITHEPRRTSQGYAGWPGRMPGSRDWSMSCSSFVAFDGSNKNIVDAFLDWMDTRQIVSLKISTMTTGDNYWMGNAIITSISMEAPMEESTIYTISFSGAGTLYQYTQ